VSDETKLDPVASDTPGSTDELDQKIAKFLGVGVRRELALRLLLNSGVPVSELKPRFPEFADSAFDRGPRKAEPAVELRPIAAATKAPNVRVSLGPVSAEEGISFQYVPLIQCSFPHADPKDVHTFTRRNGWLELTLASTKPELGLPYGVPARLLTIYCTSEAVRTQSPEIFLGESVHDFLRLLDVPITRGARGSLASYADQMLRLISSTLTIDENIQDDGGRKGVHIRQAVFAEEAKLWWDEPRGRGRIGAGSSLRLSNVIFESIIERSAPLATGAIKRLRRSPMDLDVYAWLVHRLVHLSKPSAVSWAQLSGQFGHGYREPRKFRQFFLDSLKRVSAVYPDAKFKIGESGLLLLPSRPHVPKVPSARRALPS
jgi:hypothetical protein